jgi:hypothetical protein
MLDAARRCISGRTSYHGTRLAFHPYPHLIQLCCSTDWFRPPDGVTRPSPWAWIDRSASRLQHATKSALIRTWFPYAFAYRLKLAAYHNSLAHFPRGTQLDFLIVLPLACRSMVSGSLSLPLQGFFSPFPRGTMRYRSVRNI